MRVRRKRKEEEMLVPSISVCNSMGAEHSAMLVAFTCLQSQPEDTRSVLVVRRLKVGQAQGNWRHGCGEKDSVTHTQLLPCLRRGIGTGEPIHCCRRSNRPGGGHGRAAEEGPQSRPRRVDPEGDPAESTQNRRSVERQAFSPPPPIEPVLSQPAQPWDPFPTVSFRLDIGTALPPSASERRLNGSGISSLGVAPTTGNVGVDGRTGRQPTEWRTAALEPSSCGRTETRSRSVPRPEHCVPATAPRWWPSKLR